MGGGPCFSLDFFKSKFHNMSRTFDKFKDFQGLLQRIIIIVIHDCWIPSGGNTQRNCCLGYTSYRMKILTLYHSWNTWNASLCQWSLEEAYPIYVEIVVTSAKQFPNILTESSWFYISINLRCCNEAQKFVLFLFFWGNKKCRV